MLTVAERIGNAHIAGGTDKALENVRQSCARGLPAVQPSIAHDGVWVMCGGGPSLADSVKHIRRRYLAGETIACVNGALKYLLHCKIIPQVCVLLDPQELLAGETVADARVDYLVASQCHPAVFEHLKGCRVHLWHADIEDSAKIAKVATEHYQACMLIPGGETAVLRSLMLASVMGFRKFHLYGVDSCYTGDKDGKPQHHAYEQQNDDQFGMILVEVLDAETGVKTPFYTRTDWARQADQFNDMYDSFTEHCELFVHGEGLIPHIWQHRRKNARQLRMVSSPGR